MNPLTLALIMGGMGALQSQSAQKQATNQNLYDAALQEYAPYTGYKTSGKLAQVDTSSGPVQGALSGYAMGQSMEQAALNKELTKNQNDLYKQMLAAQASQQAPSYSGGYNLGYSGNYGLSGN